MKCLNIVIIALLVILIASLWMGCTKIQWSVENFAGSEETAETFGMTEKEKELFEDLKDNKLSTQEITDLVKGGVLTEKLVEKFLAELSTQVDDSPIEKMAVKSETVDTFANPESEAPVEGFMNGEPEYASAQ